MTRKQLFYFALLINSITSGGAIVAVILDQPFVAVVLVASGAAYVWGVAWWMGPFEP